MKTTLIALAMFATSVLVRAAPLPGQTLISDSTVKTDVRRDLFVAEKVLAGTCKKSRIVHTTITKPPKTLGHEKGTGLTVAQWTESWTIDRCGKKVFYTIHFDMRGSAGTKFKIEAPRRDT